MLKFFLPPLLKLYLSDTKGATAVEYGLIAAGIAVTISAAVLAFGDNIGAMFQYSADFVAERPQ